ncbi:MAG: tripartite tricarboxylate transporter substrate binding protein [Betaproteobacteria bacterium]|nr:tripartite tricarboxylate transporter substrate binding protein [Betaproteobacteria bacterium]
MKKFACIAATLITAAICQVAAAQWTPKSTIRIVVPFAAGGPTDITARHLSRKLNDILGQPVIVDNRGGANGMIGAELVVKSKPDGYTLLMPTSSTIAINPAVYRKMPFDPVADLSPITPVIATPGVMIVTPSLPARSVKDFVALAKARPGQIVFASTGAGSNTHLALELFAGEAKIKVTHVPYKGAGPAVTDVIAGHAQALVADLPVLAPHLKSGKLRPLAITGLDRTPLFPDIPSMKELGYPQVNSRNWYALLAPARTPPEIVNRLNEAVRQAVAAPEVRDRLVEIGAEIFTQSPEEFGKFLKSEIERWKGVVAKYKIAVEP